MTREFKSSQEFFFYKKAKVSGLSMTTPKMTGPSKSNFIVSKTSEISHVAWPCWNSR